MYGINEQLKEFMEENHKLDLKYGRRFNQAGKKKCNCDDSEKRSYASKCSRNHTRG